MRVKIRLSDAMEEFSRSLAAQGKKQKTINNNMQPLRAALEIWGNIYLASITPNHIERLFMDKEWCESTRNLYLSNLKGNFLPWARRHSHIPKDYDPTEGWKNLKVPKTEKFWLPVEEFSDLLNSCNNPRDRAICAIGLFTFCRGSEISAMKVNDIDFGRHTISIYREKTAQEDTLPMSAELEEELLSWLTQYEKEAGILQGDWYLTPARSALPMKYVPELRKLQPTGEPSRLKPTVRVGKPYDCVKRPLAGLGYTGLGLGAHTLRRSGARALFDRLRGEGYDGALMRVSSMLGHANMKTTEIYLGLSIERQQRNELLAGKVMFPAMKDTGKIIRLEANRSWR